MNDQINIDKALDVTIGILNGISVPISMMEQIGIPIIRAVNNLQQCIIAIQRDAKKQETPGKQEDPEEEPKIELELVEGPPEE